MSEIGSDAPSLRESPRLWEVDHPYYCSESNFYSNEPGAKFETWASFIEEFGDSDLDMNLVFRWDWHEGGMGGGAFTGDPYYRNGVLQLFFVFQRKGIFACNEVSVCRADEPAVIAWLRPRLERLTSLWEPIFESNRKDGSSPQNGDSQ